MADSFFPVINYDGEFGALAQHFTLVMSWEGQCLSSTGRCHKFVIGRFFCVDLSLVCVLSDSEETVKGD